MIFVRWIYLWDEASSSEPFETFNGIDGRLKNERELKMKDSCRERYKAIKRKQEYMLYARRMGLTSMFAYSVTWDQKISCVTT
jgi:hypothetical protein